MAEPRSGRTDVERTPRAERERPQSPAGGLTRRGRMDIGRDPFSMMHALHREMDRLFDDFGMFGGLGRPMAELERNLWSPQVEVYERDNKLHVCADLPGLSKDDVHIDVVDNNLTIEGERKSEQRDEGGGWSERSYGRFFRSLPLPEGINPETAKASFENGVLDIAFDAPQRRETRRKIEIK